MGRQIRRINLLLLSGLEQTVGVIRLLSACTHYGKPTTHQGLSHQPPLCTKADTVPVIAVLLVELVAQAGEEQPGQTVFLLRTVLKAGKGIAVAVALPELDTVRAAVRVLCFGLWAVVAAGIHRPEVPVLCQPSFAQEYPQDQVEQVLISRLTFPRICKRP
jgi:hypothetical protein